MGNCQAIDSATLVIQHPSGRAEKFYWPVSASEVMKSNPGHYVALLLTTTTFSSASATNTAPKSVTEHNSNNIVRVTRIKLLRPADTLIMGHVYRLVSNQELSAKKYTKMKRNQNESSNKKEIVKHKPDSSVDSAPKSSHQMEKNKQMRKQEKPTAKSRPWQPSLNSISESAS